MKRQATELEKICIIYVSNKGSMSQHIKENLSNSITRQQESQFIKLGVIFSRKFTKEGIQMASKHMKRSSTSLVTWEMCVIGMTKIKTDNAKCNMVGEP